MYVKLTKSGKHTYVQIVESYRDNEGVPRHKVLFNFGRLDILKQDFSFAKVLEKLISIINNDSSSSVSNLENRNISEAEIVNWGYKIYEKLWKKFGLDEVLSDIQKETRVKFNLNDSCFLMTIEHLLSPKSKLGVYNNRNRYFNFPDIDLQHLYRSLDVLSKYKDRLEEELFYKNLNVFNMSVDVVFYDVTTFSFESVKRDSLREFGYSKDGKFNEVQVVMGLLVNGEGRPIGYELFPGNTFEGKTLELMLDKLKKRFNIGKVIIVADRGLNNKLNLKSIKDNGFDYIVASRIKNLPDVIKTEIFSEEGFKTLSNSEEEIFKYKVMDYENIVIDSDGSRIVLPESLIISYSSKRASKDMADRERLINKSMNLLSGNRVDSSLKRGGRKYIKKADGIEYSTGYILDEELIEKDSLFDGYYGIQTSDKNMSALEIIEAYHNLWRVEESFRIMKSNLEFRPIFHWTEDRIKGHFVICFLAFLLERTLEYKLSESGVTYSAGRIRDSINKMNFALFSSDGEDYCMKTKIDELGNSILKALKIKPPKNISKKSQIIF